MILKELLELNKEVYNIVTQEKSLNINTIAKLMLLNEDLMVYQKLFEDKEKALIDSFSIILNEDGTISNKTSDVVKDKFIADYNKLLSEDIDYNTSKYNFDVEYLGSKEFNSNPIVFIKTFILNSLKN